MSGSMNGMTVCAAETAWRIEGGVLGKGVSGGFFPVKSRLRGGKHGSIGTRRKHRKRIAVGSKSC